MRRLSTRATEPSVPPDHLEHVPVHRIAEEEPLERRPPEGLDQLRAAGIRDLAGTTLMSDGASVYLCTSNDEVIDLVSRGQGVFGIAVGKVLREVESTLVEFGPQTVDTIDELAARRSARTA